MKTLLLSESILVDVKKSRGRTLRLAIRPGGRVTLSLPFFVSYKKGLEFLRSKEAWITEKRSELGSVAPSFLRGGSIEEYRTERERALKIIKKRVALYQDIYDVTPTKIAIRYQKTRWASCSRKGTLSFSYRVALLPLRLLDYIIVHELCHLKEFNHSSKFWSLVAQSVPQFRLLRKELNSLQGEASPLQ